MNYVWIQHPITGEKIATIPTGKTDGNKAEVRALTAGCNVGTLWIERGDLFKE